MKLLCFLTFVSYIVTTTITETEDIIQWLKGKKEKYDLQGRNCYVITNSTDYIDRKQVSHFYQLELEAKSKNNLDYVLVVVDSIPQNTTNPGHSFAIKLQDRMAEENFINYDNSVVMLFALGDRNVSIETGPTAEAKFSDARLLTFVEAIKPDLRDKDYYAAFSNLLSYFIENVNPPTPTPGDNSKFKYTTPLIIGISAVIVIVVIIVLVKNCDCTPDTINYDYPNAPLYSGNYNTDPINSNPVYTNQQPVIHVHHHSPPKHHHHPPPHHHHPPPHHHHHHPPKPKPAPKPAPRPAPKPAPKPKPAPRPAPKPAPKPTVKAHGGGVSGGW